MSLIQNLSFSYGHFQIAIPEWSIRDDGINVLWGASGSGKSTVLRLLLGLEACSYSWILDGVDVGQLPVAEKRLGVVFQSYDLFPHMTAGENIMFAAQARSLTESTIAKSLENYMTKLNMFSFWDRKACHLSGGEQQRVALVRALIGQPRALLMDEPFAALDEDLRNESRHLVKSLVHEIQIPTILITHDSADVKLLADQVAYIKNGQLDIDSH